MKDKFKAMVERASERGFKYKGANILCVDVVCNALKEIVYIGLNIDFNGSGDIKQRNWVKVSVSDILFNHEFMRALLGEKWDIPVCIRCGTIMQDLGTNGANRSSCVCPSCCNGVWVKYYINKMFNAMTKETDEQRIDYVHGLIKGESE